MATTIALANATSAVLAAANATSAVAATAAATQPISGGDTTFMFLSTLLVQFMTPGLALFYSGMVGTESTVTVMFQSFVSLGLIFVLWVVVAFSLSFGTPWISVGGYYFLGDPSTYFMLRGVTIYEPLQRASQVVVKGFPGMLFMAFQAMFAVITPALISGAFVDRLRFGPYMFFISV
ncbi:unnamed protein product [Polarella glacialis]|uniref:Ammonium transporter AmtB-like domain-containing protein n=1 Tax=Polarella glacialis TaxID=89957 RepID=A0A813FLH5_POLGL|nr:unnamed protein product [Polarella glacialis]